MVSEGVGGSSASGGGQTLTFKSNPGRTRLRGDTAGRRGPRCGLGGRGTEADFTGRDVKGKLAVLQSFPMPSVVGHQSGYNGGLLRAAQKGAAAVLINVAIPGNLLTAVGAPNGLTTFSFGTQDMAAFQELLETGPVKVHLELTTEERRGLRDASVWGELPGTTDEDMIIMAHHDAFYEGALDNASGMAVMMGLAEVLFQDSARAAAPHPQVRDDVGPPCGLGRHQVDARQPHDVPGQDRADDQL